MATEIVRGVDEQDLPLCPVYMSDRGNELHRLAVRITDAFYDAAEKDADSEFVSPDVAKAYRAGDAASTERMPLYRAQVGYPEYEGAVPRYYAEAMYFQCRVCGFVLPAVGRPTSRPERPAWSLDRPTS